MSRTQMIEQGTRTAHYVTDDEVTAPLAGRNPVAICGEAFFPAPMTTPDGGLCPRCAEIVGNGRRAARR